ncbi:calcium:proton antiporter [Pseudolabrys taiwanensis]|uniref:Calcium:proton antiporter n=1 Tax=Pseudolabrys taiwanensis TaxID=331696 RepID=A0A346A1L9_9HYPH|nr:calcium:proton antiporter [Pseudolabrys taiwanensis]AXK83066.1 calcium:proton antiporter [Pseudolabrys taiwanensis]
MPAHRRAGQLRKIVRAERFLGISLATTLAFALAGEKMFAAMANPLWFAVIFVWLFAVVLCSALAVVRHADRVAEFLGEPYGTLVLTLSVTAIEVMSITAVMLHGENNPTLVRDTLFAIIMIILGGMIGVSLLAGGWRHREQHYNLQGANAYLGVIIPMAAFPLSLPNFTVTTPGPTLSGPQEMFVMLTSVGLYVAFLSIQTGRHRSYFAPEDAATAHTKPPLGMGRLGWHIVLLLAYIVPVVFLAEQFAHPIDYLIETLHVPTAIGGVIIAMLVATPEAIGATRAAWSNRLQRSINISLGSVLSTIGLTVPAMLAISYFTSHEVYLGLSSADNLLLAVTLVVSIVTFASGHTNILQGVVHVVLFAAFVMLIFQG